MHEYSCFLFNFLIVNVHKFIFTLHVNLQGKDKLSYRVRYFCLNMFCFVFPFLFFCCSCSCCLCFFGVAVLLCLGPSTQQYLKIQIRPPAIGSVVMVNGDFSHIFSLPLTPPPPPTQPLTHQPLFTSFGYNMPTCSTIGYEPASSGSEEPQKETGINTRIHGQKNTHLPIINVSYHTCLFFFFYFMTIVKCSKQDVNLNVFEKVGCLTGVIV